MAHTFAQNELTDRVALVTGAGGGIGRATCRVLAQAGAVVIVTDVDGDAAEAVAADVAENDGRAVARSLDVTDAGQIEGVIAAAAADHGRLDILVNNAGIGAREPATELSAEAWDKVVAVNLTGGFLCAREAARHMLGRGGGSIITVASVMGLIGGGLYPNPAYQATKGGLVNLTRALALEWAEEGVRVNAVAPAFVRTPLTEALLSDPALARAVLENTPLGRLVEPEEVAAAIVFLASDAASMITGHTLPVDGGWLAR